MARSPRSNVEGRAEAPAAGTVVNALATGTGSAFAVDRTVTATVTLDSSGSVDGEVGPAPNLAAGEGDPELIQRCVELALERYADDEYGGTVRTESEVPVAAGLASSSAAANAAVLATCSALGVDPDPLAACRLGVRAAREAGVTATGAFDDAAASMLGGVAVTDNGDNELLVHDAVEWDVLVWVPPGRSHSADADVERCRRIAPLADLAVDLARDGRYPLAMSVNGFAYAAALGYPTDPLVEALASAEAVSVSGTGPAVTAIGDREGLRRLRSNFENHEGTTWLTTTRTTGARTR